MYSLTSANKYYLYQGFIRMNLGINGLYKLVRSEMSQLSPVSGDAFISLANEGMGLRYSGGTVMDSCYITNALKVALLSFRPSIRIQAIMRFPTPL